MQLSDVLQFANNVNVTLAGDINSSQTTIDLAAGSGARLPVISTGQGFNLTLENLSAGIREIVYVTGVNVDTITCVRAQESQGPFAFTATGTTVQNRDTAATYGKFLQRHFSETAAGQFLKVDIAGEVQASLLAASDIPVLDASKITTGQFHTAQIPPLDASIIATGTLATARLGSGTANSSSFLRGDQTWASIPGAPSNSQYILVTLDPALPNARRFGGGQNIDVGDTGPGGLLTINVVQGPGSGLNADLLDGHDSTYYTNYNNLTNVPSTFPAAPQVLATTSGLGSGLTTSGLTAGMVLRATGATTAAFQNLIASDIPNLSATKITSGTLAVAQGGTGLATYVVGDILYASGSTALSRLAGNTTTTKQFLVQTGDGTNSAAPQWGTIAAADVPGLNAAIIQIGILATQVGGTGISNYTLGGILYGNSSNGLSQLAGNTTALRQFLSETGDGTNPAAPVWVGLSSSDIPNLPGTKITSGTVAANVGGTGFTSYTLGDMLYASGASALSKLSGNTSATNKFLTSQGNGTVAAAPAWNTIQTSDLGSGTASTSTFLRGDLTWATASGGITTINGTVPINASTVSGTTTISLNTNGVTNAFLAQMGGTTIKGNISGIAANATDLTATQVTSMLNAFTSSSQGLVPASGGGTTNFLRADGSWAAVSAALTSNQVGFGVSGLLSSSNALTWIDAQQQLTIGNTTSGATPQLKFGTVNGNGNSATIAGSDSTSGTGNGGNLTIRAGNSGGSGGTGGQVIISGGVNNVAGSVLIQTGSTNGTLQVVSNGVYIMGGLAVNINGALGVGATIGSANFGSSNQVFTSNGTSAPSWTSVVNSIASASGATTGGTSVSSSTGAVTISGVAFTSTVQGMAPASGGGTTNFLRADGTWAAPPGGAGTVTSVGITIAGASSASISVSGSPVTSSGSITLTPNLFGTSAAGVVPASGGGTTNFLRADGTWAAPSGGSATPGGSTTQVQFNLSGAFAGDAGFTYVGSTTQTITLGTSSTGPTIQATAGSTSGVQFQIKGSPGTGSGNSGGTLSLIGGAAGTGNATGGAVNISGASGAGTGTGGAISLQAGNSGGSSGAVGGNVTITGGTGAATSTTGGNVVIASGSFATGGTAGGDIIFQSGATGFTTVERFRIQAGGAWSVGSAGTNVGTSTQFLNSQGAGTPPVWATPPTFTSGAAGYAPASGGGTTNFLRADGTWAVPPGGAGGSPGGPSNSVQFNSAGAFGGDAGFTYVGSTTQTMTLGTATVGMTIAATTGSGAGTTLAITGSNSGGTTAAGGPINITAGSGGSTTGAGGAITITTGAGVGSGAAASGALTIATGTAGATGSSGNITIQSGNSGSTGNSSQSIGNIAIQCGTNGTPFTNPPVPSTPVAGAGSSITIMASSAVGSSFSTNAVVGGSVNIVAGNCSTTQATGGGNINITAGNTSANGGSGEFNGEVRITGGANNSSSVNGLGGTVRLTGGASTTVGTTNAGAVIITGGAGGINGTGSVQIIGGAGGAATNAGSAVTITGGAGGTTSGNAGGVSLTGGTPTSGSGGGITLTAAASVGTTPITGGTISITAGAGSSPSSGSSGAGGAITLTAGAGGALAGTATGNNGGAVNITAGAGTGGGFGGNALLQAGNGGSSSGTPNGGQVGLVAGGSTGTGGSGGTINILAGGAPSTGGTTGTTISSGGGGAINIISGSGVTSGAGGNIAITTGAGASNNGGTITITTGNAGTGSAGGDFIVQAGNTNFTSSGLGGGIKLTAGVSTSASTLGGQVTITGGTGGTVAGGGGVVIAGGLAGGNTFAGGNVSLTGGAGNGTTSNGGSATLAGGNAPTTAGNSGTGGAVQISGGSGGASNTSGTGGNGGAININAGNGGNNTGANTAGAGGTVTITAGSSGTAPSGTGNSGGSIVLAAGNAAVAGNPGVVVMTSGNTGASGTASGYAIVSSFPMGTNISQSGTVNGGTGFLALTTGSGAPNSSVGTISGTSGNIYLSSGLTNLNTGTTPGFGTITNTGTIQIVTGLGVTSSGAGVSGTTGSVQIVTGVHSSGNMGSTSGVGATGSITICTGSLSGTGSSSGLTSTTGSITISTGALGVGSVSGVPGSITISGGVSGTAGNVGGAISITAGNGSSTTTGAAGASVTITAGNAGGSGNNNGGSLNLTAGTATGSGTAGSILMKSGATSLMAISPSGALWSATTGGVGYGTGAGGTVTQATSRTTGVTLNKICGSITLVSAAGSTSFQSFVVTNSLVAATDIIDIVQKSGTDTYQMFVTAVAAGSFTVTFATTGGTTTEQPVFNFAVTKAVTA